MNPQENPREPVSALTPEIVAAGKLRKAPKATEVTPDTSGRELLADALTALEVVMSNRHFSTIEALEVNRYRANEERPYVVSETIVALRALLAK